VAHTNRLANETSPYLLQHAHNPVDWYAWSPQAFEAARKQDKPIFLSVGYSTCYWCHVMERQCFEIEAIAKEMNDRFINIKVDREERPDVDQTYMMAVQVLTRHGGWPMSVFLTPDLRPFYGGTYFPPSDSHGRPGFVTVLRAIDDAYHNRRDDVNKSADQLVNILQQLAEPTPPVRAMTIDWDFIDQLVDRSISDYDPVHGGFGGAPKFPRETLLEALLVYLRVRPDDVDPQSQIANRKSQIQRTLKHTLDSMAHGGIRDQLGGGFHRYSTDAQWLVPHFEIMLYDNAMLAWCYVEAYRQTEDARYARVARGIFDFVLREMTSPDGAFYTAFDAEVDAQEGLSYLWTADEVRSLLTAEPWKGTGAPFSFEDAKLFARVFGLDAGPNFSDPHHGSGAPDKNILFIADPDIFEQNEPLLRRMSDLLYGERRKRKQPLLDAKIITSWNALMIRAFAYGGSVLQDPRYIQTAERAAQYLVDHHLTEQGDLVRTSRDGATKYTGFLDDYAFFCQSMLALHDAGADEKWREEARALSEAMKLKFADARGTSGGFYFTPADAPDQIVRQMVGSDSPLPSGNAVAAMVMQALDQPDVSRGTLSAFAQQLEQQGEAMGSMLEAAMLYVHRHGELKIEAGKRPEAERPLSPDELAKRVVGVSTVWHDPKQLEVRLQILKPFHINSNTASSGLIKTQLNVSGGAEVESIDYPPGTLRQFDFTDEPITVYDGEARIIVRFKLPVTNEVNVSLHYQACDETACLPEVARQVEVHPPLPPGEAG
jgi:uncharacterized protein YyaL (SSP411 family)